MPLDTAQHPASSTDQPAHLWRGAIRWDDGTIAQEMVNFPEEIRQDFRWLKITTRDQFKRNIDLLVEAFRKVGVLRTKETWSKVLKGRYLSDSRRERGSYPVVNAENFAREVEALRSNTREEALRGKIPFIDTTITGTIFDYIADRREVDRVNKFGFIIGHTGTQKTASFKEFRQRFDNVWWFEAPENGQHGEFLNRLVNCSGLSPQNNADAKRAHLLDVVKPDKCIIVDNFQDLYRPEWKERQPNLTFLRRLQDETNCTIIGSITPYFKDVLLGGFMADYFEQFIGRSGGSRTWVTLPEHAPDEDVLKISESFNLKDAKKHLAEMRAISREPGRIRRLFEDLQGGKQLAAGDPLTIDHIRDYREE